MSGNPSRWRRWILPSSLAINIFLLTIIGIHAWHRPHGPPDPRHMIEDIVRSLPGPDAEILRRAFAAEPLLQRDPIQDEHDPMSSVREALRSEPFDPEAFAAGFRKFHEKRDRFEQSMDRALIAAATAMSPEGRRRLADHRGPPGPPPPDR